MVWEMVWKYTITTSKLFFELRADNRHYSTRRERKFKEKEHFTVC